MKVIELRNISKSFGGLKAVDNLTFTAFEGQIKAIIGPNGAGKTTVFNIISGLLRQDSGEVIFRGQVVNSMPAYRRARLGIGRTFQKSMLFEHMSVYDNVLVISENVLKGRGSRLASPEEVASEVLRKVKLFHKKDMDVSLLTPGERHLLEIARAMALSPYLLLLDEPAAGLNDEETKKLGSVLNEIREEGICILLVEHDMKFVMSISDEVLVMHEGRKIAEGPPLLIHEDEAVIEAYLGTSIHSKVDNEG